MGIAGDKDNSYFQHTHTQIDYREHVPKWTCSSRGEVRKTKWPPALPFYSTRFYKFPYQLGRLAEACRFLSDKLSDYKRLIGYYAAKDDTLAPVSLYLRWNTAHLPRAPPI